MKTAEEFFNDADFSITSCLKNRTSNVKVLMIEFAKMHVEEALNKISKSTYNYKADQHEYFIDMLESYPLENIK